MTSTLEIMDITSTVWSAGCPMFFNASNVGNSDIRWGVGGDDKLMSWSLVPLVADAPAVSLLMVGVWTKLVCEVTGVAVTEAGVSFDAGNRALMLSRQTLLTVFQLVG